MVFNITGTILLVALISVVFMLASLLKDQKKTLITKEFVALFVLLIIHSTGLILQIMYSNTTIPPIYFDYITYVSAVFIPVIFTFIAITYMNKEINIKKYMWLIIIPIISLLVLWTNDFHGLFYKVYSININEVVNGTYMTVHIIYSYGLMLYAFIKLIKGAIKKSGFLSWQTILIIIGALAPVIPNVLGTLKVIPMTIYITPMMFTVSAICFYIAIVKLKALNITPVALKTVTDNMSDAFVVISEDGTIADANKTFYEKFSPLVEIKERDNLYSLVNNSSVVNISDLKGAVEESEKVNKIITKEIHLEKGEYNKYFEIDFQTLKSKSGDETIATLLLMRDVTRQKKDMEIITRNENLVILGELAGGVAHDVNTPISAIKTGVMMLKDTVTTDNEKDLLKSMDSCADKIITLVNSLRNQIRNIGSENIEEIKVANIINDTQVILHNELTKHNVTMSVDIKDDLIVKGNPTKLSQVITNIVLNGIQAYSGTEGEIKVSLYKDEEENAVVLVKDNAGGIPDEIKPYIFKNILTTKGVSGTGFGLYLAYSVIKGAFGGEITFDTEKGKGTEFYIKIPISNE